MKWGKVKRLLSVSGLVALVAVIAATAALAQPAPPAPAPVYCVNGATTTLPTTLTIAGGSRVLTESIAGFIISTSYNNSLFYLGFIIGVSGGPFFVPPTSPAFDPATFFVPGYSTNSVSPGVCAPGSHPKVPGSSFMCASGYGALSNPDYVAGKEAMEDYLAPPFGRHYAFYVQGDLNGVQRAQAAAGSTPAGSFYCRLPEGLRVVPIIGSDGKQMLADTQGYLYDSGYANGETIGHPAYRLST